MSVKKVWSAYFSPTGTTKKTVTRIAARLAGLGGLETASFNFTLPSARSAVRRFEGDELVVCGLPVYAGRLPNVLLKYLDTLEGGGALAVLVVSFGNRSDDEALKELSRILEKRGFRVMAGAAFVGEHSFSNTLGQGRPDAADLAMADAFADQIYARLIKGDTARPASLDDGTPLKGYFQPRDGDGNPIDIRKVLPKLDTQRCILCGLCARVCPMGSIDHNDVRQYVNICIKCGACIKQCPEQARYYDDANYLYHKTDLEKTYTRRAEPTLYV